MALEDQKRWIILVVAARGTFKFRRQLKWHSWCLRAICFHLSQHAENETKSRKRRFWLACEHRQILVGYLKLFRFMSVTMVQTKCKLNNTELFLKLFRIQCKEIGTISTTKKQQNLKNGKVRFRLNIDVRKEIKSQDSRLNAIECLKTDYVRKRSSEF